MKNKPFHAQEDVDYWRSMLDVVLGLLLIVLLAMSLLLLGFMDRPLLGDETGQYTTVEPGPTISPTPTVTPTVTPTSTPTPTPTPTPRWHGGGGGGDDGGDGGHDWTPSPTPTYTPMPTPEAEGDKSAVQVIVRDEETKQILSIAGIGFQVTNGEGEQLSFNVYYPERKKYNRFETTASGRFYLPEKVLPDDYTLENLSVPKDYDMAEDTVFEVEKGHDWNDPVVVDVYLAPCKNSIALKVLDAVSGEPVPGGQYEIVAVDNVITSDGTIRYRAGDVVETIACNEDGEAETGELYLGTFSIVMKEIPFGYARGDMGRAVFMEKKPAEYARTVMLDPTTVLISVRDELRLTRVPDMPFVLTGKSGQQVELKSDANGEIRLTGLEKDTDYSFRMKEKTGGYLLDETVYSFTVDADGLIAGVPSYEMTVMAKKLKCSFGAVSMLLSTPIVGHDIGLFADDGAVVQQWYSGEVPLVIEDLEPGSYVLTMDGRRYPITVRDTAQAQVFYARVWLMPDILVAAAVAALAVGGVITLVVLSLRRKKRGGGEKKTACRAR